MSGAEVWKSDELQVQILPSEMELGRVAARNTAEVIRSAVAARGGARVAVATGTSQFAFVEALRDQPNVQWNAVTIFHLDEYVGIDAGHPASFRRWIRERITEPFAPAGAHYIVGDAPDTDAECRRYEELLRAAPLDLVCMGIGENGHLAFNEPHQANFTDPAWVRVITLDDESRAQQVGEGHFATVDQTPRHAISLTIPALLSARAIQAVVPEQRKAKAVLRALTDEIGAACPATILRRQQHAKLFLDQDSASLLDRT